MAFVKQRGVWLSGLGLAAAAALLLSGGAFAQARPAKIEVEGTVSDATGTCPDRTFRVGDLRVVTDARTDWDDGTCQDLTNGRWVEVEGTQQGDGTVLAREVDFD